MTALALIVLALFLSVSQSQSAGSLSKSSSFVVDHASALTLLGTIIGFTGVSSPVLIELAQSQPWT